MTTFHSGQLVCLNLSLTNLSEFLLLAAVSFLRKQLPESILIDYIRQFINILMPLALALILGYGWAYKRGSFGKTLLAGLFALILFSFTFLTRASEAILNGETSWKSAAGILFGIIILSALVFVRRRSTAALLPTIWESLMARTHAAFGKP